jgi:hypothetical protein
MIGSDEAKWRGCATARRNSRSQSALQTAIGGEPMRSKSTAFVLASCLMLASLLMPASVHAQGVMALGNAATIALKSGESTEVFNLSWVVNCRSFLNGTPEVEILDGPPQVSATVKPAKVLPRVQNCSEPVEGGTLVLSAKDIVDPSFSLLTLRITYKTPDGDRKFSQVFNLRLLP